MTKRGRQQHLKIRKAERQMTRNAMRYGMTPEQWAELERSTWERGRREEMELMGRSGEGTNR